MYKHLVVVHCINTRPNLIAPNDGVSMSDNQTVISFRLHPFPGLHHHASVHQRVSGQSFLEVFEEFRPGCLVVVDVVLDEVNVLTEIHLISRTQT